MKILTALIAALLLCSCSMVNKHSKYVGSASDALRSTVTIHAGEGMGSGFHIGGGYFVTNAHVVLDQAGKVPIGIVYLIDGAEATLVGYDASKDLAILYCGLKSNLKPFKVSLAAVSLKDDILSVGTHYGVIELASKGFVSVIGDGFIVTTAPMNRGCSGGALLNEDYEIIGVNAWGIGVGYDWSGISGHIDAYVLASFLQELKDSIDAR
jgi:serine protease DegS